MEKSRPVFVFDLDEMAYILLRVEKMGETRIPPVRAHKHTSSLEAWICSAAAPRVSVYRAPESSFIRKDQHSRTAFQTRFSAGPLTSRFIRPVLEDWKLIPYLPDVSVNERLGLV